MHKGKVLLLPFEAVVAGALAVAAVLGVLVWAPWSSPGTRVRLSAEAGAGLPETSTTAPEAPVTMDGVAARLDCPDPPDPNVPAPNPPGPGDLASSTLLPAPGYGEATPEAALEAHVREALPGAPLESFVVTARNSSQVRFENDHAAFLVVGVERGAWNVTFQMFCGTIAAEWRAGRR